MSVPCFYVTSFGCFLTFMFMILIITGICDNRFREFSILRMKCGNLIFLTYSAFIFLWSITFPKFFKHLFGQFLDIYIFRYFLFEILILRMKRETVHSTHRTEQQRT